MYTRSLICFDLYVPRVGCDGYVCRAIGGIGTHAVLAARLNQIAHEMNTASSSASSQVSIPRYGRYGGRAIPDGD